MELEDNRIILDRVCKAFAEAGLSDLFAPDSNKRRSIKMGSDITGRLLLNDRPMPYKLEDVVDVRPGRTGDDRDARCVRIVFQDGKSLTCLIDGIELNIRGKTYHNTDTILSRLNYIYRKEIRGLEVHPMVIIDRVLVAFCEDFHRVVIPEGVVRIAPYAFESSEVRRVIVPDSLQEISDFAFWDCKYLESMMFDGTEEYIGDDWFGSEEERVIRIPRRIRVNPENAFNLTDTRIEYQ